MDIEDENRILIFSELLKKIRDTKGPITLFELSNLFDSNKEVYDLIFHGIPSLPYNRAKNPSRLISADYRIIPVVHEIDSIPKRFPNGITRFVLNKEEIQIYDFLGKSSNRLAFKSRLYSHIEEDRFFRQVQETDMEREIQQRRRKLQEIFSNQATSTYSL